MKAENITPKTSLLPESREGAYDEGFTNGKREAYLDVLRFFHAGKTVHDLRKELELALKVLQKTTEIGGTPPLAATDCPWESWHYHWEVSELRRYITISVDDIRFRLEKARSIYKAQQALLSAASQVSIDDLIKKD